MSFGTANKIPQLAYDDEHVEFVDNMPTKLYAVARGRAPGIYKTWQECERQTFGFSNARYESFWSEAEAEAFVELGAASDLGRDAEAEAFGESGAASDLGHAPDPGQSSNAEDEALLAVGEAGAASDLGHALDPGQSSNPQDEPFVAAVGESGAASDWHALDPGQSASAGWRERRSCNLHNQKVMAYTEGGAEPQCRRRAASLEPLPSAPAAGPAWPQFLRYLNLACCRRRAAQ